MNISGKALIYFETEEYGVEDLVENLDDTNVAKIVLITSDGREITLSSTQFIVKELVSVNEEDEEEYHIR